MSYCRWSCDDFKSDIYAWADCSGCYVVCVATKRLIFKDPLPPPHEPGNTKAWIERNKKVTDMVDGAERNNIGLPFDGMEYREPDLDALIARLKMLKEVGYNVPPWAIESAEQEARDIERGDAAGGCDSNC